MPLLSALLLAIPMEPAALCALTEFPHDLQPKQLDVAGLDAIITEQPDCMPAHFLRGFAELDDDDRNRDDAILHFERALELAPDNAHVLIWLGQTYLMRAGQESSLGDARTGKDHLEVAVKAHPENLDARAILAGFHRGAPWIAGGDIDDAYEQAEEIRKRDPLRGDLEMARTLAADDEEDEAVALYREVIERNPQNARPVVEYAVLMHELKDFKEAHRVLFAATRGDDADMSALYQLGRTAALSGEFIDDGRAALTRYIARLDAGESAPAPATPALWRLGMIEQHAGRIDLARAAFERALEFDPDHEESQQALRALEK